MAYTLSQLTTEVRRRADMENSTFVSDAEVMNYINGSYSELYDILVIRFEDYFIQGPVSFTLTGASYDLPEDVYKVRGIDYLISGNDYLSLRRWNFEERNKIARVVSRGIRGSSERTYRTMGQTLRILPEDKGPGTYRIWYVPRFTPLQYSSDEMGDVLDFHEYVIVDAAIKCLIKEESNVQELMLIKQHLKQRIEAMASNRDTQNERIGDVVSGYSDSDWLFPRS